MKATLFRVTSILAVVLALTAVSANAQGVSKRGNFVVPFEFSVGEKVLPAGEYVVSGETQLIRIQSKDRKQHVAVLPVGTRIGPRSASEVRLKFRRYGDQYQLSQVWLDDGIGRELKRQRTNSDIAQNYSTIEVQGRGR